MPTQTTITPPTPPRLPQSRLERIGLGGWRLLFLISLGIVAWQSGAWWRMVTPYEIPARLEISGIANPVGISRDDFFIPTIRAQSEKDAYFALGFVHAQDRFWSMEKMRRTAQGRLAEILGSEALESDSWMRTLNLQDGALKSFPKLDLDVRTALRLYTAGINEWLAIDHLPPEILALGYEPEPWQESDSLLIMDMFAFQMGGNWRKELNQAEFLHGLKDWALDLSPHRYGLIQRDPSSPISVLLSMIPEPNNSRVSANSFTVSGKLTASGKPLLANDIHLNFTEMPVAWHLSTLMAPTINVSGATIAGIPFHLVAHNGRVAWGITNSLADTTDIVIEETEDGLNWKSKDGHKPFIWREETIAIKGEDSHILKIRSTDHGPIISDLLKGSPRQSNLVLALKTTWFKGDNLTLRGLYILNRSADMLSARKALTDIHAPALNFSLATTDGDIALQTAGRIPQRHPDNLGIIPQEGWKDSADWQAISSSVGLPAMINPASSLLIDTNTRQYSTTRLQELLGKTPKDMTWMDMAVIQKDNLSIPAREILPRLLMAAPKDNPLVQMMIKWNGAMDKTKPQPLIFHVWMDELWKEMKILIENRWADLNDGRLDSLTPYLHQASIDELSKLLDSIHEFHLKSMVEESLNRAEIRLKEEFGDTPEEWTWGEAHQAQLRNSILEDFPLVSRWSNRSFAMDGDNTTLNRSGFGETYEVIQAAGLRVIFDLNDLWYSRFMIATGQSGHLFSPHYDDLLPLWQENKTITLQAPYQKSLLMPPN